MCHARHPNLRSVCPKPLVLRTQLASRSAQERHLWIRAVRATAAVCSYEQSDHESTAAALPEAPPSLVSLEESAESAGRSWRLQHSELEMPRDPSNKAAPTAEGRFGYQHRTHRDHHSLPPHRC